MRLGITVLAELMLVLFGSISVMFAGAGRGGIRGHSGEAPALASFLHIVALVSVHSARGSYGYYRIHLVIACMCGLLALMTIGSRNDESRWAGRLTRGFYVLAYVIMMSLVAVSAAA
jgi:hypothetical protein